MPMPASSRRPMCSLVLCGGAGTRMNGRDKPLELWGDQPLVAHVLRALPAGPVVISANRSIDAYKKLGWPVVSDQSFVTKTSEAALGAAKDYEGPLAGVAAAVDAVHAALRAGLPPERANLDEAPSGWLYVVPGDTPRLPSNLAEQLLKRCAETKASACCAETKQLHPLPVLLSIDLLQTLPGYLARGRRSVIGWLRQLNHATLSLGDDAEAHFVNVNTAEQLAALGHP